MLKKRVIAVILDDDGKVVQSIKFRHTNIVHYDTKHAVEAFAGWSVDEIVLLNVSRDAEKRGRFVETLAEGSRHCFVPLTAGGWITDEDHADELLRNGADKLIFNTALADKPELVTHLARKFGKQCIVASIDVKRDENGKALVHVDRGQRCLDVDPVSWAKRARDLGAGEIFFNSIDHDGARRGYDLETLRELCKVLDIPVIGFGGVLTWDHLYQGIEVGCDAVGAANQFHYQEHATRRAKSYLMSKGVPVRSEGQELPRGQSKVNSSA